MSRSSNIRACNSANRAIDRSGPWLHSVMSGTSAPDVQRHTHYIRAFSGQGICGEFSDDHDAAPTCPFCRLELATEDAAAVQS